jgi:hypothetical protein
MFERLNEIIDKNLKLIFDLKTQSSMRLYDLDDKSYNDIDTKRLAIIMRGEKLVSVSGRKCDIATFGLEVSKEGGWLTHLENEAKTKSEQQAKIDTKERLETKIAELTEINLTLQNKQLRTKMLFSIVGFILGVIATNWKEISTVLKIISPPVTK